jgi:hypothetical protein
MDGDDGLEAAALVVAVDDLLMAAEVLEHAALRLGHGGNLFRNMSCLGVNARFGASGKGGPGVV